MTTLVQIFGINERSKGNFNAWLESMGAAQTNMAVVVNFNLTKNTQAIRTHTFIRESKTYDNIHKLITHKLHYFTINN